MYNITNKERYNMKTKTQDKYHTGIYKKKGRRYIEIGVYENEYFHYPIGSHLVVSEQGSTLTKFNIQPDYAPVLAALETYREAIQTAMHKATELKVTKREYTKQEQKGIDAYIKEAGLPITLAFEGVSMNDIVQAGIDVILSKVKEQALTQMSTITKKETL